MKTVKLLFGVIILASPFLFSRCTSNSTSKYPEAVIISFDNIDALSKSLEEGEGLFPAEYFEAQKDFIKATIRRIKENLKEENVLFDLKRANQSKNEYVLYLEDNSIIPDGTFCSCYMSSVVIADGVLEIGRNAFGECYFLTSIIIPESIEYIGEGAFAGCIKLASVIIPEGIEKIEDESFCRTALRDIQFPTSLTSIGNQAFWRTKIKSLTIPNTVTHIGDGAFAECENLSSVTIPNSVTDIGSAAFSGCTSLKSIYIPTSVTSIGEYAFSNCSSLSSIKVPITLKNFNKNMFKNCPCLPRQAVPTLGYILRGPVNQRGSSDPSDFDFISIPKGEPNHWLWR